MQALKQIVKIPRNHELKIKVPSNIPENETVEVILIVNDRQSKFEKRINELKYAVKDNLFMEDMDEISKDFEIIDSLSFQLGITI